MLDSDQYRGCTIEGEGWDGIYELPYLTLLKPIPGSDISRRFRLYIQRDEEGNGPGAVELTDAEGFREDGSTGLG